MNSVELLKKPLWTNKDIATYLNISLHKASDIRKIAKYKYNGVPSALPTLTKRDAVFEALGLNFEDEIRKLSLLEV